MRIRCLAVILASALPAGGGSAGERLTAAPPQPLAARSCPEHGPGFAALPGTTACLRLRGRVRAEADRSAGRLDRGSIAVLRASGQIDLDARTATGYGPLRAYVRIKAGQGLTPP